jgi:hypothetical protein
MPLIGSAAMLLWFDIVPEHVKEFDEWIAREHFPERIRIPGFLRAQRWVARSPTAPRNFISYEVRDIGVLTSAAYEARLNQPSERTRRMMPHFRGMVRGFCRLEHCLGSVMGAELLSIRYGAEPGREAALSRWLGLDCLPAVVARPGIVSACMLGSEGKPPMTAEQELRGRDAGVDRVILVSGYAQERLEELCGDGLDARSLEARGAVPGSIAGLYRLACRADGAGERPAID